MKQIKKQRLYLPIIILGILVLPIILLVISNRLQFVNFDYVFPTILESFSGTMIKAMPYFLLIFLTTVFITIISTTLLFEVKVDEKKKEELKNKRYWKYFFRHLIVSEKRNWHILLGYFLGMIMLNPVMTDAVIDTQIQLQNITEFQGYFLSSMFLIPVLITARILSKLEIQIIDTNIGVFIALVYVSEVIFATFSGSYVPLEQLYNFVTYKPLNAEGVTMIYGSTVIGCLICLSLDWLIVKKIMNRSL